MPVEVSPLMDYIQEKALKEYESIKGEFIHPLDWRHHLHDINPEPIQAAAERPVSHLKPLIDRMDSLTAELRAAVNRFNVVTDKPKGKKVDYYKS